MESTRNPALERLDALVGEWRMEAGPPGGPRWSGEAGDEPETFRQYYFDSRGVHRIYEMSLRDGAWKLWRDAPDPFPQRYTGTFSDDGETIAGRWEKAEDGSNWDTASARPSASPTGFGETPRRAVSRVF